MVTNEKILPRLSPVTIKYDLTCASFVARIMARNVSFVEHTCLETWSLHEHRPH